MLLGITSESLCKATLASPRQTVPVQIHCYVILLVIVLLDIATCARKREYLSWESRLLRSFTTLLYQGLFSKYKKTLSYAENSASGKKLSDKYPHIFTSYVLMGDIVFTGSAITSVSPGRC